MLLRAAIKQLQDGKVKWESLYAAAIRARLRCDMNLSDVISVTESVNNLGIPTLIETARQSAIQVSNQYTDKQVKALKDNEIASLDTRCTDLESRMTAIDRNSPPGRMKAAENEIGDLKNRMDVAESDIDKLQSDMDDVINTLLPAIWNKIVSIEDDISDLGTEIAKKPDADDIPAAYDDGDIRGIIQGIMDILNGNTFVRNDRPDHRMSLSYNDDPIIITGWIDGSQYQFGLPSSSSSGGGGFAAMDFNSARFPDVIAPKPPYAGNNSGQWSSLYRMPADGYLFVSMESVQIGGYYNKGGQSSTSTYACKLFVNGNVLIQRQGLTNIVLVVREGDEIAVDAGHDGDGVRLSSIFKFFNHL